MIIVDVETAGINAEQSCILSIGALEFSNPNNQFYGECRIWDDTEEITEEALKINGFSKEQIRDKSKKSPKELLEAFLAWMETCEEKTMAGENPFFDRSFLKATAEREEIKVIFPYRTVDLHSLCYSNHLRRGIPIPLKNKRTDLSLKKIFPYVGLPEEPMPHNALTGAKMEAEAFSRLILGKNLLKEFEYHPVPEYLHEGRSRNRSNKY